MPFSPDADDDDGDDDWLDDPANAAMVDIWTQRLILAVLEDNRPAIKDVLDAAVDPLERVDVLQSLVLSLATRGNGYLQTLARPTWWSWCDAGHDHRWQHCRRQSVSVAPARVE